MNKKNIIILLISILILVIIISTIAFSKYAKTLTGEGNAQTAQMICETSITAYDSTINNIDPYCQITVKNFNGNNKITETSLQYTITVSTTDGSTLPEYYCLNSQGNEIANSSTGNGAIIGELGCSEAESAIYTMHFVNAGDSEFTQNLTLTVNTIQKN